jgi:type I restriction enzyme S subunit
VQKGFPNEPLLAATQTKGVVKKEDYGSRTVTASKDFHLLKLVEIGDYVISLRSFQGGFEVAHHRGIISPAYTVLKPRSGAESGYFSHFFKSKPFIESLSLFVTGIREGQNIDYSRFSRAEMPLPPDDEQAAIVRFLDHENRKTDQFIRAKRRLIALLNEQKQAIIHRAVTRGLDAYVPLKPSGIPWIGNIPAHWHIWRIGHFAKVGNGSTPSRGRPDYWFGGTYPWLNSSNVNRGHVDSSDQFVTPVALRECHLPYVQKDSVLVAITGQGKTRGMSAVLSIEATINQHLAFITSRKKIVTPHFLHLALSGAYAALRALSEDSGSTKGALTCEDIKRFKVPVPPMTEQKQLLDAIERATLRIKTAIARTEQEISLVQEYRTRLTADIVTGKLDVRAAAAKLPDVEADIELSSDAVELDEELLEESETEESDE